MRINDVIIIGAGPAGLAAAIQLKRYNIYPVIFEKSNIGGLLKNAGIIENYPGFPEGIPASDLIKLFEKQLEKNDINIQFDEILDIDYKDTVYTIKTLKEELFCKILIVASGTKPKKLPEWSENLNKKVHYDICSLIKEKNKKVAIIGAGDGAFDYALNLSKNNQVLIINRSQKAKCLPLLWDRCTKIKNISYLNSTVVRNVDDFENQFQLTLYNTVIKAEEKTYVDHLLVSIGREPNLDFINNGFKEKIEQLKEKKVLFMTGDVNNSIYRQVAICTGDGIKAAMQVYEKLSEE